MVEINSRFKITSDCEHEKGYWKCPECGEDTDPLVSYLSKSCLFRHICGIDWPFFIVECPKCFHRYKFHYSDGGYKIFVDVVEIGKNLHFQPTGDDKRE